VTSWVKFSLRGRDGGLPECDAGHTGAMTVLLIILGVIATWSVLMLPLAVAVGRAFHAGTEDAAFAEIVRDYDALGV
jgi:hypothetical protein